jgi:hypothetical protein
MNAIAQMAISTQMIQNSVGTIGANVAGGASGSRGHQGGGANGSSGFQSGASGHQSPVHTYTSSGRIPIYILSFRGDNRLGNMDRWDSQDRGRQYRKILLQSTKETTCIGARVPC